MRWIIEQRKEKNMSSREHKDKIWGYIEDIKVGMLVSEDGEDLRARPMHIVQDKYDGTIWFYTKKSAEKVSEMQDKHRVCLTFCNHDDGVHVSLSGFAHLTQNKMLIDKYWNPFVEAWFDGGKDSDDVALLEIKVYKGEHWDSEDNKFVQLYEIAKANVTDENPDLGENEKFG